MKAHAELSLFPDSAVASLPPSESPLDLLADHPDQLRLFFFRNWRAGYRTDHLFALFHAWACSLLLDPSDLTGKPFPDGAELRLNAEANGCVFPRAWDSCATVALGDALEDVNLHIMARIVRSYPNHVDISNLTDTYVCS